MLSWLSTATLAAARGRGALLRSVSSYKSSISLENLYPNSSLKLSTPSHTPSPDEKFSGYIPMNRLEVKYSASSGPGGQNVNKVHTKVDVRFRPKDADWLHPEIRQKLIDTCKNKLTKEGYLIFKSDLTRSQYLNLADCLQKMRQLFREAAKTDYVPSPETEEKIRRRLEKANRERLAVKRINAQKRADLRSPTIHDL